VVLFVCSVQASISSFSTAIQESNLGTVRKMTGPTGGYNITPQALSDCPDKEINIVLGGISMDTAWKGCIMSVFPAGVVTIEDSDQFRNSHSQESCEKLESAQRQPMKRTQGLNSILSVLFK